MTDNQTNIEFTEITNLLKPHQISVLPSVKNGVYMMIVNLNTPLEFTFSRNGGRLDLNTIYELDNPEIVLTFSEFKERISWQVNDRRYLQ